jgi:hypothetical protein
MQPCGRTQGNPIRAQGGFTELRPSFATGHRFTLIVGSHKGGQFLGVVQAGRPPAQSNIDITGTQDPSWARVAAVHRPAATAGAGTGTGPSSKPAGNRPAPGIDGR